MRRIEKALCLLLCAALLLGMAPGGAARRAASGAGTDFSSVSLGDAIESFLREKKLETSSVTVGWYEIESGQEWYRGADNFLDGGGIYKLPLAMLYADWIAEGSLAREDKVGAYTAERAVRETITSPGNNAADVLRTNVSASHAEYRAAIAPYGGLDDYAIPESFYRGNQFSARFLIGTLRTLWDGRERYGWLIDCMKQTQPDNGLGRGRGDYELAHKIGRDQNVWCDAGIFYTKRPFLLAVMCSGVPDAESVIGEIARLAAAYAEYLEQHPEALTAAPKPSATPKPAVSPAPGKTTPKRSFHYPADFSSESFEEVIERYLREHNLIGRPVSIGWCDLTSGEEFYRDGDLFMEGASTYKLPLAMIYADKIADGELTEQSRIRSYNLREALELMIIKSNNYVGEALRDNLTRNYSEYRRMLVPYSGLDESELPGRFFRVNAFSPRFLIGTLRTLWDDPERYALVIDLMKQARPDDYFSRYRGDYEVAHKYGSDEGYVCDSGIIYCERPFLLCVMTSSVPGASAVLGEIARIAMDYAEYLAAQPAPTPEPTPARAPVPTAAPAGLPVSTPAPEAESAPAAETEQKGIFPALPTVLAGAAVLLAAAFWLRKKKKDRDAS